MMNLARKSAYKGLDEAVYFSEDELKDKILRQKTMEIQKRVKFAKHFA